MTTQDGNAIDGVDYQAINTPFALTLTPADASVQQQFTIPIVDDAIAEPGETFDAVVNATVDSLACPLAVNIVKNTQVAVTDDDAGTASLTFSSTALSVNETAGSVLVQVTLNGAASLQGPFTAQVDVSSQDGTANGNNDFSAVTTTLTFDETQNTQTVTVPITNDAVPEATESFSVVLSNASAVLNDQRTVPVALPAPIQTVTIVDDDNPGSLQFSSAALTATENGGSVTVTVNRTGGTLGAVSVDYASAPGTATAGIDFTAVSGTLNWPSGDGAAKTFALPILNDALIDANETIVLTLTNATGGATAGTNATVTIADDEAPLDAGGDVTLVTVAGATVSSTFFVNGAPPITLSARLGTLSPTVLNASGNATYSYVIPASTPAGTTLNDTVTVTDAGGQRDSETDHAAGRRTGGAGSGGHPVAITQPTGARDVVRRLLPSPRSGRRQHSRSTGPVRCLREPA